MTKWSIAEYDPARHEDEVYALWCHVFPEKWAVVRARLHDLFSAAHSLIAIEEDRIVGFAGTIPTERALAALMVEEGKRRRGIGSALFEAACEKLRRFGAPSAVIGGTPMLWIGVPVEFGDATAFFRKQGCMPSLIATDLYRFLHDYEYPAHVEVSLNRRQMTLGLATPEDAEAILDLQRVHFPEWLQYYAERVRRQDHESIGCVRAGSKLLGTILIGRPGTEVPGEHWAPMAPHNVGSFGVLGVPPIRGGEVPGLVSTLRELAKNGWSLGYGLAAFATQQLKESGAQVCFLNEAVAEGLFRKLGYQDWALHQQFEKAL